MAVLSKIRERSLFLILIIAMALFAFVLSGLFDASLFNKTTNHIGEVNGDPISREEFAQQVDFFRSRSQGRSTNIQNVNNAWNGLVREKIYKTQLEKSGVVVGERDVWDALVAQISMQNSPQFQNEAGLFDEELLKEYIATLRDNSEEDEAGAQAWVSWLNYEKSIKESLEQNTYNGLVRAGLGTTLKEGERDYFFQNTSVDVDYVYVPFNSIPDTSIVISESDIEDYIKARPKEFTVEESRNIRFVHFEIEATKADTDAIQKELNTLKEDREEYSNAAKTTVNLVGFANATDIEQFNGDYESDTPYDGTFYQKEALPQILADSLYDRAIGEVYGPYKDGAFYKMSKVIDVKQMPDSVRASHILLSFVGSASADATVTATKEEAKAQADSVLAVVKANPGKFEDLAKEMSMDKVSGAKGGDLDWFVYKTMVPEFRDYAFSNRKGDMGVIETQFGYHIIKIDDQKNIAKAVKIGTFSRAITPSEETENAIFEQAETFASDLTGGGEMTELAGASDLQVRPVLNLEVFDDNIPRLGSQRQIIRWAFDGNTSVGDVKRFDLDNGYAVVQLEKKNKGGLALRGQNVRGSVLNERKAELIAERSTGSTLEEIAGQNGTEKRTALAVSNTSPVFAGQGRFEEIAGVATSLEENELTKNVVGKNGVAFLLVTKKTTPAELDNYASNKRALERTLKGRNFQIYQAIKDNSEIVDNRPDFY